MKEKVPGRVKLGNGTGEDNPTAFPGLIPQDLVTPP